MPSLLKLQNIQKDYLLPKKYLFGTAPTFRALHGIDLTLQAGMRFGVVGESGCGKSTLARIVMGLEPPTQGEVYFEGNDIFQLSPQAIRSLRSRFQMVFQDPYGSLNPKHKISRIVSEPLETLSERLPPLEKQKRVHAILQEVGLTTNDADKFPHEFSGGQRQRIAIARALITNPSLIVADEAVSALDVSVQAQVLNLMMELQKKYNLTFMFISHDLSVVELITDEMAVLYLGRIVESGKTHEIFQNPHHPYTKQLIEAIPIPDPQQKKHKSPSSAIQEEAFISKGCPFRPRCDQATQVCAEILPGLEFKNRRNVACHHVE